MNSYNSYVSRFFFHFDGCLLQSLRSVSVTIFERINSEDIQKGKKPLGGFTWKNDNFELQNEIQKKMAQKLGGAPRKE